MKLTIEILKNNSLKNELETSMESLISFQKTMPSTTFWKNYFLEIPQLCDLWKHSLMKDPLEE